MLIVGKNISRIGRLKKQLGESFPMKDMGAAKQIFGIRIMRDKKREEIVVVPRTLHQKSVVQIPYGKG